MVDHVLVVDDEQDLVASYERLLRRQGYRVIARGSRQDGLAVIAQEPLVLVIADLRLPDGDGLDVIRAARHARTPIPAIVVTGFGAAASRQAALAAGAFVYLAKPFAAADFTAAVQQAVGRSVSS